MEGWQPKADGVVMTLLVFALFVGYKFLFHQRSKSLLHRI